MIDFSDDEKIKLHLKEVQAIQEKESNNILTLEDLKELNLGIGVSEKEWDLLLQKANKKLELAEKHLSRNNYEDAFESAQKAVEINPFIQQGHSLWADASYHLWLLEGEENYRIQAEKLAEFALEKLPSDSRALDVLKNINLRQRIAGNGKSSVQLIIGLLIGVISLVLLFFIFTPQKSTLEHALPQQHKTEKDSKYFRLEVSEENYQASFATLKNVYSRKFILMSQIVAVYDAKNEDLNTLFKKYNNQFKHISDVQELTEINQQLEGAYRSALKKIISENPSDKNMELLIIELEGAQNRISYAKRKYNQTVKEHNLLIKKLSKDHPNFSIKKYIN